MEDIFVTKIQVDKFDDLIGFSIPLSTTERNHFIVTGVNGSGKTRFLESLRDALGVAQQNALGEPNSKSQDSNAITLSYSKDVSIPSDTTVLYFPASREAVRRPKRVVIDLAKNKPHFLDFMLSMQNHNKMLYRKCFSGFQGFLQELFDMPELQLKDDLYEDNYGISIPGSEPFPIEQIFDSYASLINIYSELAMRSVLLNGVVDPELPALVLIDELEAHLDVVMQKRIFSILTHVFPNTQFFIATNSPFIITALENCTVFDIGSKNIFEETSEFSYLQFMQFFYNINHHSLSLFKYMSRYHELASKENLTSAETDEFNEILCELGQISYINYELSMSFKRYERLRMENKNRVGNGAGTQ
ncbi:MAG: AAA family ATPase [Clostridiales bacterium]|jgi:predicted ATPase|nr:AAA family ATPase [Clostridiales bacterium]